MAYQTRPSLDLGLSNLWLAWQFDNAVLLFGRHVESELNKINDENPKKREIKRKAKLHELLDLPTFTYAP